MSPAPSPLDPVLAASPVIPVVAIEAWRDAPQLVRALKAGGVGIIEITLRTPDALEAVRAAAAETSGALIGAGTLLTPADVESARRAGAVFGVSPGLTPDVVAAARDCGLPLLPGVATASELMTGLSLGLTRFKLFPAAPIGGVELLRAFAGPFPEVRFCPTGGLTLETAADYLALANVACVGGSWLTPKALLQARDWAAVEALARRTFERLRGGADAQASPAR